MDPGALSEAEAELVRRERGERKGGKERKERRVVAGAVGRRVLCRGSGAVRAQQVRLASKNVLCATVYSCVQERGPLRPEEARLARGED